MANEISTAGVLLKYKAESSAGTRPTSGYVTVPNIKSTGAFTGEPNTLEVTDLSDTVWKRYINGLKDPGGAIAFTANLNSAFKTAWATAVSTFAGLTGGKALWWEIYVPTVGSFYFAGEPASMGIDEMGVDAVAEVTVYIAPNQIHGWDTSSTT